MPTKADALIDQSEAELDRQARAETEAGLGIPIEVAESWIESWDMPNELPMPKTRKVV